jgi:hypothetical protein
MTAIDYVDDITDDDESEYGEAGPEPAPGTPCDHEAVAAWLDAHVAFIRRYVVLASEHHYAAVALWSACSWFVGRLDLFGYLTVTSAIKPSGKSRLLEVVALLVPRARTYVLPSAAAIYSVLSLRPRPTLLLDELDAVFGPRASQGTEELRGVINAGWDRRSTVPKIVNADRRNRETIEFNPYGAKVLAAIGGLPDTIMDRSVHIDIARRIRASEPITRFRYRIASVEAKTGIPVPDLSTIPLDLDAAIRILGDALPDRAEDVWEPLIALALAAGGEWPERARAAATTLAGAAAEQAEETPGEMLLADLAHLFENRKAHFISTETLITELTESPDLAERPWLAWRGGKPITAAGVARLLKPFHIRPVQVRQGSSPERGYALDRPMRDAIARFVGTPDLAGTSGTAVTPGTPDVR